MFKKSHNHTDYKEKETRNKSDLLYDCKIILYAVVIVNPKIAHPFEVQVATRLVNSLF